MAPDWRARNEKFPIRRMPRLLFKRPPAKDLFGLVSVSKVRSFKYVGVMGSLRRILGDPEERRLMTLESLTKLDDEAHDSSHELDFFRFVGFTLQSHVGDARARTNKANLMEYLEDYDRRQKEEQKSKLSEVFRRMKEGDDDICLAPLETLYEEQRKKREVDLSLKLEILLEDSPSLGLGPGVVNSDVGFEIVM